MLNEVILLVVIVVGALVKWVYKRVDEVKGRFPPGPKGDPVLGNLSELELRLPHVCFEKWGREGGGMFTMWIAKRPVLVLTDLNLIKEVFVENKDRVAVKPFQPFFDPLIGYRGMGNRNMGPEWEEQREFIRECLEGEEFRTIMEEKVSTEMDRARTLIQTQLQGTADGLMDISGGIKKTVTNIVYSLILGDNFESEGDVRSLIEKHSQQSLSLEIKLMQSYPQLQQMKVLRRMAGYDEYIKREQKLTQILFILCQGYVKELESRDDHSYSEKQFLTMISEMLYMGVETTVATLKWAIHFMISFPDIQEKIRDEIVKVVGRHRGPTLKDKLLMPLTCSTIKEIQRLANITPVSVPHIVKTEFTLNGYSIPAGVTILAQISAVTQDEELFPNPVEFDPLRFMEDDYEEFFNLFLHESSCLGKTFTENGIFLIFAYLLQTFEFSEVEAGSLCPVGTVLGVTLAPAFSHCKISVV